MESYPRQCAAGGQTFTEESCSKGQFVLTLESAKAAAMASECSANCTGGCFKGTYVCNENTGTWWLDLELEKEGCSPACVVDVETRQAEINWRCTGLLQ
jgi:hypothetical protein